MVNSYKDLLVWQKSHAIAMQVFTLFRNTKKDAATFEIWKQIIRSVFSVPSNIVEGYYSHIGLNYVSKINIAKGEAGESDYWLLVLSEIGDISNKQYNKLSEELTEVIKMLTGLSNKLKEK